MATRDESLDNELNKPAEVANQVPAMTSVVVQRWENHITTMADDLVADEVPVALVYNGISHAVMMATPTNLEDFALGFSLTEGLIDSAEELYDISVNVLEAGIEVSMTIASRRFVALKQQRRNLTGRTGCGLCGTESLQQVMRPVSQLPRVFPIADSAIQVALAQLNQWQPLRLATGACHGAAWCSRSGDILMAREDVGRHNALDKLLGALVSQHIDRCEGFIVISSRASYEMVQKAVVMGVGTLVAVSAPTSLALDVAKKAGLKLVGFGRDGRHVNYT